MLQFVGDNAREFTTAVRQRVGRVDRRDSARAARDRTAGRRARSSASRCSTSTTCCRPIAQRPRHRQHPRGRRADPLAEALRDVPAVDAVGAVRAAARSRRSGQADAGVLLRRGAPAVRRRAGGARREDRAGRAADPIEGRRRVLRHAEPVGHSRHGARAARQPRAARAARVHAARSEGGEGRPPRRCGRIRSSTPRAAITELAVGEALVSLLDEKGSPTVTERAWIVPPASQIGPIADARARRHSQGGGARSTATTSRRSIASRRTRS